LPAPRSAIACSSLCRLPSKVSPQPAPLEV
jgi:hypothetical protein